ncbi:hypothetical protein K438DRAFT_1916531 [Mycena galopus ATCC 62051]|nr:hypothetical protein K438DRAFT_1916531 [Mycena galopus ATCC 62051]
MFGGATTNPYDDIVVKTTDEHLTSENWELILNLCDKVTDEGPDGAHNVVAALLKRLTHRNPNVQLYALSLAEALSKNCGIELHRELASRAWTAGLERVVTDRNTHDKVRTRALGLVAQWTAEFADDSTLGVMGECYEALKAKNYKYTRPDTPPPPAVDDAIRRREEEELQRVLEMSVRDRGGRGGGGYAFDLADSGAGGSSSSASAAGAGAGASVSANGAGRGVRRGYMPAAERERERTPSPDVGAGPTTGTSEIPLGTIVTRVRALHPFAPTEAGELGFEKGDVIKVVDRGYKDWWRGQLRGRTGIFPVNYVEPLPDPTPAELAAEAAAEGAVFAQAVNVERLLNVLRGMDPERDNLAEDEEVQELYRSCMALRPKIVKLIDKYSQKRADLVSMNETFVRARTIFDRMMEESLARNSGGAYYQPQPQPGAWGGYPDAAAYAYAQQQQQQQQQPPQGQAGYGVYGAQGPTPYPAQGQAPQGPTPYPAQEQYQQQGPTPYPAQQQPQAQQGPTPYPAQQQQQSTQDPYQQAQAQGPTPYPAQTQAPAAAYQQPAQQAQPQPQAAAQPVQQQQQPVQQQQSAAQQQQQQPAAAAAAQAQPEQQAGPPYVYDPHATYADPNVQAWAQYYAAGGKDLAGSVYFVSIPGITDAAPAAPAPAAAAEQQQQQQAAAAATAQQQAQAQAAQQQAQAQAAAQAQAQAAAAQAQAAVVQQQAQAQAAAVAQQQQQQRRLSLSPSSPIDDDPGYFPDPYANQPEYATPTTTQPSAPAQQYQQQQPDYQYQQQQPAHTTSPAPNDGRSELAHALGHYRKYSLADPGAGSASQPQQPRQGYSLTDPGSGSGSGPVSSFAPGPAYGAPAATGGSSAAAYGAPAAAPAEAPAAAPGPSTPSWVLPKKSPNLGARGGQGSPPAAGLAGQFAGMQV